MNVVTYQLIRLSPTRNATIDPIPRNIPNGICVCMSLSRLPTIFGRSVPGALLVAAAIVLYSAAILYVWLNYAQHAFEWLPYNNYFWA